MDGLTVILNRGALTLGGRFGLTLEGDGFIDARDTQGLAEDTGTPLRRVVLRQLGKTPWVHLAELRYAGNIEALQEAVAGDPAGR
jgi:hypothetical protein